MLYQFISQLPYNFFITTIRTPRLFNAVTDQSINLNSLFSLTEYHITLTIPLHDNLYNIHFFWYLHDFCASNTLSYKQYKLFLQTKNNFLVCMAISMIYFIVTLFTSTLIQHAHTSATNVCRFFYQLVNANTIIANYQFRVLLYNQEFCLTILWTLVIT